MQTTKYLIAAALTLSSAVMSAQQFESEGLGYKILSDAGHTVQLVASSSANPAEVIIPDTVGYNGENYAVVSIGVNAFATNTELTRVTLPATLRDIQNGAFFKTTKLTTINARGTVPADITASPFATVTYAKVTLYVPAGTWFEYQYDWRRFHIVCEYGSKTVSIDNMKYRILSEQDRLVALLSGVPKYSGDFTVPGVVEIEGKDYKVVEIGSYAFDGATGLTSVSLPASIQVINNYAFRNAPVKSITLPAGLRMIKEGAFSGAGLEALVIPPRLKRLENLSFTKCGALKKVTLCDSLEYLGNSALSKCPVLEEVTGGRNVNIIMESTFLDDVKLVKVDLPNIVTIKGAAFRNTAVRFNFPKTLRTIELQGFMQCKGLTEVVLPDTMTEVGATAFAECPNLVSVVLPRHVEKTIAASRGLFNKDPLLTSVSFPDNASVLPQNLFNGCSGLKSFVVPVQVKELGASVFANCKSLRSVRLPEGMTKLGSSVFSGCDSLVDVNLPESLTSLGMTLFNGCKSIRYMKLPSGIKDLPISIFGGCSSLDSVSFSPDLRSIGRSAFINCTSLKSISVPEGVTVVDSYTFKNCSSLDTITLPRSVTVVSMQAFNGCAALRAITLRSGVKSVGAQAFAGCSALKTVSSNALVPPVADSTAFDRTTLNTARLLVRGEAMEDYVHANVWKEFSRLTVAVDGIGRDADTDDIIVAVGQGYIEVTEGAEVYDLYGTKMNPASLRRGVYIVRKGTCAIKVAVP